METISQVFHALVPRLQLVVLPGTSSPRLHDLRHSFAVGTLLRWYRSGVDPQSSLLRFSTFLGHVDPLSTSVYLTMIDPLLDEANRRFEAFARDLIQEASSS
jgi:integrase/recombinase XerD